MLDLLIIAPSSKNLYQDLASKYSAVETNIWAGLLANSVRSRGYGVAIYDLEADPPTSEKEYISRCESYNPKLVLFVCTGQNPNASTAAMDGAVKAAQTLKNYHPEYSLLFVGPHVNALPLETLQKHDCIDGVFTNEGVYSLLWLLENKNNFVDVPGIWYRDLSTGEIVANKPAPIVPQEKLHIDLPGVAYDLMPSLDNYRTSLWHTNYVGDTSPFASIYTSLGCIYKCNFCLDSKTKITLSKDRNKFLKDVVIGDKLIGWDESTNNYAETTVVNTSVRVSKSYLKITIKGDKKNTVIKCTEEHPFYLNGKWVQAKDLKIHDQLLLMGKHDKTSFRLKLYNPTQTHDSGIKSALTKKKNGFVPYMCTNEGRLKIGEIAKKRALSDQNPMLLEHNRKSASERMRGENNPCWAGGVSTMYQEYPIEFSTSLKRKIRKRDERKCQECHKKNCKLDVHHIDYNKQNNDECNLITLCASCHSKTNFNREYWQNKYVEFQQLRGFCAYTAPILNIEKINEDLEVRNLECSPHNNYFANNVLVHNCMINIINRTDNDLNKASDSFNTFRYWDPEFTIRQFDYLASKGVKNIKVADEMWVLKPKHFMTLCDLLIERQYGFNIWAYTRVDTVKPEYLEKLKAAGVNWLALGVETANQEVRREITKGRFENINIRQVVKMIQEHDINVGANYIVGLGHDTWDTMQETLNLALELNAENSNIYAATALPGSPLYLECVKNGWELPSTYSGYGFLSYDHLPSRTPSLTAAEVLSFRDYAFHALFENPRFLNMINQKFGPRSVENIQQMTKIRLKRKILGD